MIEELKKAIEDLYQDAQRFLVAGANCAVGDERLAQHTRVLMNLTMQIKDTKTRATLDKLVSRCKRLHNNGPMSFGGFIKDIRQVRAAFAVPGFLGGVIKEIPCVSEPDV